MLFEFFGGAVIKVKIKGFLNNLTEQQEEQIDIIGIKKSNTISYINNNIKHKLIIEEKKLILQRENEEFSHEIIFVKNKIEKTEYYLKELHHSLEFNIETISINISDNKIDVTYKIIETENIYNYLIELSDKYEY